MVRKGRAYTRPARGQRVIVIPVTFYAKDVKNPHWYSVKEQMLKDLSYAVELAFEQVERDIVTKH